MPLAVRKPLLDILRPATAMRYCARHLWLLINAGFLGLSVAAGLTVYFASSDNRIAQALVCFLSACIIPTLANLATGWQYSVIQGRFGHLSEHTNHDLQGAVVLAIARLLEAVADNAPESDRTALRALAAMPREQWFALFADPALRPEFARLVLDKHVVSALHGTASENEARVWQAFLVAAFAYRGGSLPHEATLRRAAAQFAERFRFVLREVLKHDFATDGKAWAAYQLAVADKMFDARASHDFSPAQEAAFLDALGKTIRAENASLAQSMDARFDVLRREVGEVGARIEELLGELRTQLGEGFERAIDENRAQHVTTRAAVHREGHRTRSALAIWGLLLVGEVAAVALMILNTAAKEETVARVEEKVEQASAQVARVQETAEATRTDLARVADAAERIERRVEAQSYQVAQLLADHSTKDERIDLLNKNYDVAKGALGTLFELLGTEEVPEEKWPERIAEWVNRYRDLETRLAALELADPQAESLRTQARAAIEAGDLERADALLAQIEQGENLQVAQFAETRATRGDLAMLRYEYLQAAEHYRSATTLASEAGAAKAAEYRGSYLDALYQQGEKKMDNAALERLIIEFHADLENTDRAAAPEAWARLQNLLGNVLQTLGRRETSTARLEEAVVAYRAALEEYTRERVPLDWARTQNNLGNVLGCMGEREAGSARLEESLRAYHQALMEITRERAPLAWATIQSNMGAVLKSLGEREADSARLEEAVQALREALEERTRELVPFDWAMSQNNLGSVLQYLGESETGTARLEEAVEAYRAALQELTHERSPFHWAATQANLGCALTSQGERESGTARLEEAIVAYHAALQESTREAAPLQWARVQYNLGNALKMLGERESSTTRLEEAVAAYRAALEERTRERVPLDWARTQASLCGALEVLDKLEPRTSRLEEAVDGYRAALEELTRERVPLDWARTQNNLGNALSRLGERESGTTHLVEAVAAYRAALEERTYERVPLHWARTQFHLANALWTMGERGGQSVYLIEAIESWRETQKAFTRHNYPAEWAQLQNTVGYNLAKLAEREYSPARIEDSVAACGGALEVYSQEEAPREWAMTQDSLGYALMIWGEHDGGIGKLEEAVTVFDAALEVFEKLGDAINIEETSRNRMRALAGIEKLKNAGHQ